MKILKGIGIFFLVVLVLGGIGAGSAFFFTKDIPPFMDTFFETLKKGEYNKAYTEMTSQEFQKNTDLKTFTDVIKGMALDTVKNSQWGGRQISYENEVKAIMEGEVTTEKEVIPLYTTFVKEGDNWKLQYFNLQDSEKTDPKGISKEIIESPESLPSENEQKELVKNTILLFLEDIEGGKSFSKTYSAISDLWKQQITEEKFTQVFADYLSTPLSPAGFQESTLHISSVMITPENALEIKGEVQVDQDRSSIFTISYISEHNIWKVAGIKMKTIKNEGAAASEPPIKKN
ncbi:MAG: hypothetical protein WCJ84_04915 [Candidatus Peregrinibacteria bacterium]